MPKNDVFMDSWTYSPSIVTKVLKETGAFKPRLRASLNTPRSPKRGQMKSVTLRIDMYPDADCIEQVHALAAFLLASSLGWSDRNLVPIKSNRLKKKHDTGEELIWIKPEDTTVRDFLDNKRHWFATEEAMAFAADEVWPEERVLPESKDTVSEYKNDICDMKV